MAQVVVVDDHPIARMAVRYLLEQDGHTVLAESADGREAVTLINQQQPDIVIIDIVNNIFQGKSSLSPAKMKTCMPYRACAVVPMALSVKKTICQRSPVLFRRRKAVTVIFR